MDSENVWIRERLKLHQLLQDQPDWSLRHYARELHHDLHWGRCPAAPIPSAVPLTLDTFRSRSRAPQHPPPPISEEAKQLVGELRHDLSEQFHRPAGAQTIRYGVQQYQQQYPGTFALPKASSTITPILHELGGIAPQRPTLHEPLDLPAPMTEWELDLGEIVLGETEGAFEFFVVIDRGTSRLVYLEGGSGSSAETALEAVARLFQTWGLPERARFDRHTPVWGAG
jgi:hypothetical protein